MVLFSFIRDVVSSRWLPDPREERVSCVTPCQLKALRRVWTDGSFKVISLPVSGSFLIGFTAFRCETFAFV